MSILDLKIKPEDIDKWGVVASPDTLTGTAQENKMVFDRLVKNLIATTVNTVIDEMAKIEVDNEQWAIAEAGRVQAELVRVAAEAARVAAEQGRSEAEIARAAAEAARVVAENARAEAERLRAEAEAARVAGENGRVAAEAIRHSEHEAEKVWEPYSAAKSYVVWNKVSYEGSSYICKAPCRGVAPPSEPWELIVAKGDTGDEGPQGAIVDLKTGVFAMQVIDGHLMVLINTEEAAPPLEIDENGHLIYHIEGGS